MQETTVNFILIFRETRISCLNTINLLFFHPVLHVCKWFIRAFWTVDDNVWQRYYTFYTSIKRLRTLYILNITKVGLEIDWTLKG